MSPENAIEVRELTKKFKVYFDKGHTLKEKTLFRRRRAYEERKVLNGISFDVKRGEAVGLIGHNGCGKSTTLKLLTRIMYPDSGTITMQGRVSSLIELGAGFHPDLSGRENIYINASIFGLTRKEIDARLDEIISFSELEEFIDNPVRTYSSGMYMRLAFSVAINVDADILLIDEILAVGDAGFQAKCFHKLKEIKAGGTTIVIVSHSLGQIEQICEKSYWIHNGSIAAEGPPREVHPQYLDYIAKERVRISNKNAARHSKDADGEADGTLQQRSGQDTSGPAEDIKTEQKEQPEKKEQEEQAGRSEETEHSKAEQTARWGNGMARITSVRLLDGQKHEAAAFCTGDPMVVEIRYHVSQAVEDVIFGIGIFRMDGVQCYGTNTKIDHLDEFSLTEDGTMTVSLKELPLLPAQYTLDVAIESGKHMAVDYYTKAKQFEMVSSLYDIGVARIVHQWELTSGRGGEGLDA